MFIGSPLTELTRERQLNGWQEIEALNPHILLDPARGVASGSTPGFVKYWRDQANGFVFFQNTGSNELTFNPTGSSPTQVPSIECPFGSAKYIITFDTECLAPFSGSQPIEIFSMHRRDNTSDFARPWAASIDGDVDSGFEEMHNSNEVNQYFRALVTASVASSVQINGTFPTDEDRWSTGRVDTGNTFTYEARNQVTQGGPTAGVTRQDYDNLCLFARSGQPSQAAATNYWDGQIYGFVVFNRELTPAERAIVTGALDRIMGLGY